MKSLLTGSGPAIRRYKTNKAAFDSSVVKTHLWQQKGNLYLWRYQPENRNYPGLHITGDSDGLKSLAPLIQNLESDSIEQSIFQFRVQPNTVFQVANRSLFQQTR